MNLKNPLHRARLAEAMGYSRRALESFREHRADALRQFVGASYSDNGSAQQLPINLIELAVSIFARQLAAFAPRVITSTPDPMLKRTAARAETRSNQLCDELDLASFYERVVKEALFGIGLAKVALGSGRVVEIADTRYDVGVPFACVIDLDNWVHDTTSPELPAAQYMGDLYRPRIDVLRDIAAFPKKFLDKLEVVEETGQNEDGSEQAKNVGHGQPKPDGIFAPKTALWDIWFPYERVIGTFKTVPGTADIDTETEPAIVEYEGPDEGPYHTLCFNTVPGNIMPLPPVAGMMAIHDLTNSVFRKLADQAERQKTITAARTANRGDAERIKNAGDGAVLAVENPESVKEYKFGGVDQVSMALTVWLKELFSYTQGNLDGLGGLSPMSETLGQDRMMLATASKRVAVMQDKTIAFAKGVQRAIAWWDWTDPLTDNELIHRVEGTEIDVQVKLSAEERKMVNILDLNIDIVPYSMQHSSPGEKLQSLTGIWNTFIVPAMPMMQEQGITPNLEKMLRVISKWANMPELEDILTFAGQPSQREGGLRLPASPVKTSTNIRENRTTGGTGAGRAAGMIQSLLGGSSGGDGVNMGRTMTQGAG